jgi:2-oxoglutarate dehydrogenase E2 component (dihydrolipoamide succinyltransferase)
MAQIELIMPKMGESVAEATIIKWLKEEGDTIEMEEAVLEIATDKVDSEVPSPTEGILKKKLFAEDDVVKVGDAIAIIETEADAAGADAPKADTPSSSAEPASKASEATQEAEKVMNNGMHTATAVTDIPRNSNGNFYSPLVRSIAKEEGLSVTELDAISGTGAEGRVTKKDVLNYIETRTKGGGVQESSAPAPAPSAQTAAPASAPKIEVKQAPPVQVTEGAEIIEMDRMRKMISEHMVMSKHTSPHVTSFVEADVTNIVNWRNKIKDSFQKREGEKMTFTPIFIEAVVKAIKDFPMINVSVDGTRIIKHRDINVGMAAALPSGNLIVPVIKKADQLNLIGITKQVNDLANRARANKLKPDEISGGTFTLTNVGSFGNVMGTPIINQPQVAILAVGSINKKPAVIETPDGDFIGIRHKMFLSHSYDHRVVDGALGGSFVRRVADYLEAFDPNRDI